MIQKFKTAIFDLDGTLIDSVSDLANACNIALTECGYPTYEVDEYNYFVGNGLDILIERIIPEQYKNEENLEKLNSAFVRAYSNGFNEKTNLYDGIEEVLDTLSKKGVILCIASNKPDFFVQKIVKGAFKKDLFTVVRGKLDGVESKPSAQIVDSILSEIKIDKSDVLFIGDTNVDIFTAKNAGVKSVGCLWGFRDFEELNSAGADIIIKNPYELLNYF